MSPFLIESGGNKFIFDDTVPEINYRHLLGNCPLIIIPQNGSTLVLCRPDSNIRYSLVQPDGSKITPYCVYLNETNRLEIRNIQANTTITIRHV
ncbi:MAG TPA: hypothetical protein PK370_01240 [Candidatus Woesebacteria bacterium]|nr:hypothetical protein [Candidatus Woesebacteria bacterium]